MTLATKQKKTRSCRNLAGPHERAGHTHGRAAVHPYSSTPRPPAPNNITIETTFKGDTARAARALVFLLSGCAGGV